MSLTERVERENVATVGDAIRALTEILQEGVSVDAPFHCYLAGSTFAVWAEAEVR